MKNKNYLIRRNDNTRILYGLARGHALEEDETLALVRVFVDTEDKPKGIWAIIDIASGLHVLTHRTSRKALMERWNQVAPEWTLRIEASRTTQRYAERLKECQAEYETWRQSGYQL